VRNQRQDSPPGHPASPRRRAEAACPVPSELTPQYAIRFTSPEPPANHLPAMQQPPTLGCGIEAASRALDLPRSRNGCACGTTDLATSKPRTPCSSTNASIGYSSMVQDPHYRSRRVAVTGRYLRRAIRGRWHDHDGVADL